MMRTTAADRGSMRMVACDGVLLEEGKVLLIKRKSEPFKHQWALPGGKIEEEETAEECVVREFFEETGIKVRVKKLIGVFSDPKRDPRKIISIAFLVEREGGEGRAGSDAEEVKWFDVERVPRLAADHNKIIKEALKIISRSQ